MQKKPKRCITFRLFLKNLQDLFASLNRSLAEVFHKLHKIESSLASASAGSLVALLYLSGSIHLEYIDLSFDLIY